MVLFPMMIQPFSKEKPKPLITQKVLVKLILSQCKIGMDMRKRLILQTGGSGKHENKQESVGMGIIAALYRCVNCQNQL